MITKDEARRIAAAYIREGVPTADGITPVILDEETLERHFGWIFFYQSQEFLETRELGARMAGNAPLIVDRDKGSVHETGTAHEVEHYLAAFENRRLTT